MLKSFLRLFLWVVIGIWRLIVIGSQPAVLVDTKNILLKDVINIRVVNMVYNEIGNSLVLLLFMNVVGTILIYSQNWAIIFFGLGVIQTISITLKYNLLEDIGQEQKKIIYTFIVGFSSIIKYSSHSFYLYVHS